MTSSEYEAVSRQVDQAFDVLDNAGPDIEAHVQRIMSLLLLRVTGRYVSQGLIDDMVDARAGMYRAGDTVEYQAWKNRLHDAMHAMILGQVGVSA